MSIFDFLKTRKNTAQTAKSRLQIIISQERVRGGHDYLPDLRRDVLAAISKYIDIDLDAVKVDLHKDGDQDVLDITVSLPEGNGAAKPTD